ncbi:MAG: PD40 domain-containing protein [Verrucomicrobiales bacterium]|nr:PD40 domain-containing protein [Verrucomicrobiales bacterium]
MNLKRMIAAGLLATALNSLGQSSVVPTNVINLGDRELLFGEPVELPWETPETQAAFPCITPDGLTLYFASDRPGGVGQRDIWVTTRPTLSARWGTPINLGAAVNTTAIEDDPFLSADGLSLYFDSTRPGSLGSRDLWVATRPSPAAPFGPAVHLGPAINSSAFDGTGCVSRDHLTLLFGSQRSGRSDIWMSTRSSPTEPWPTAQNLGEPINLRSGWEVTPSLSADGLTLFFFSDRHRLGSGSLWASRRTTMASAFGPPALIRHISDMNPGGADSPVLSTDEATLYFNTYPDGFPGRTVLWQSSITILPQLRALGMSPAGEFQLELLGREGVEYEIEVSPDFKAWTPWLTTNTSTRVMFSDPAPVRRVAASTAPESR